MDIDTKIQLTDVEGMSSFQCCVGWSHSIGCNQEIWTQMYKPGSVWVKFNVHHINYKLHSGIFYQIVDENKA